MFLANTGRAVGVDFSADQTSGRERRSPMPVPCIPVVMAMNADAVLLYSPCARFGRGTLLEALSTITKLLALCGPVGGKNSACGREASVGLEFEGRERCAEAGAQRIRSAKN